MKFDKTTVIAVVLAFLLGIGLALAAVNFTQAKTAAYLLAEVDVKDYDTFAKYAQGAATIMKNHGGKYLVRGGMVSPVEGNWIPGRIVLVKFDGMEQARKCLNSPEYRKIKPLRDTSSSSKAIILEGTAKE